MTDVIDGSGRFSQYTVSHLANGDRIFGRVDGVSHGYRVPGGGTRSVFTAVATLTGGTGRFARIRGLLKSSGVADLQVGVSSNPIEGEYWFED